MRRKLREQLPLFAHLFGLHPRDIDGLTFGEIDEFQRFAESYVKGLNDGG